MAGMAGMEEFAIGGEEMAAITCLLILAIMCFFFVTELLPLAVTAMAGALAVGLVGLVPLQDIFNGLSNGMVILMAGMLVVGAAMFHTGLAQRISEWVVRHVGKSENSLMLVCMGVGAVMSMVGDLAASAIKRNSGIKDYGTLIPGHGGIMDRFDSMIVTAPMVYFLAVFLLR